LSYHPKPKDKKKEPKPPIRIFKGGREICRMISKEGRDIYAARRKQCWERQNGICYLQITEQCKKKGGRLALSMATLDHENGRGGGKRDDRVEIPDPKNHGKMIWQHGAACMECNIKKGSRSLKSIRKEQEEGYKEGDEEFDGILFS
jgi:5-methylcytosine-specific restriction endonuclease McrA